MRKILLWSLVLAVTTAASGFGQDRLYQKEFAVDDGARFSLNSYKGTITIRTDNVPTIRVTARIYADGWTDPESIGAVRIKERAGRDSVSLEVDYRDHHRASSFLSRWFSNSGNLPLVDWDIMLPDSAGLALNTYKSDVSIDVPAGRVQIDSYKGRGSIRGVRNNLQLETYKGNFHVEVRRLEDLKAHTYKGEISLEIFGAHDFNLQARSHKGVYRFRGLSIPVERYKRRTEVSYVAGSGRNRINLETYKGVYEVDFR